jgi:hypothetical protein
LLYLANKTDIKPKNSQKRQRMSFYIYKGNNI